MKYVTVVKFIVIESCKTLSNIQQDFVLADEYRYFLAVINYSGN